MSVAQFQARRVVTGSSDEGRSRIEQDDFATARLVTPSFTVVDLWRTESVPASMDADDGLGGVVTLKPPDSGIIVRIVSLPPDKEWQAGDFDEAIAGFHTTNTVDVVTVIEGELWAVMREGEVLLRAGDSIVQRGTEHAWSNRSSAPATIIATMYAAAR